MTPRLLVTGCRGQLGSDLMRLLSEKYEATGTDLPDVDIANKKAITDMIVAAEPVVVIHAAAHTGVDDCEGNRELAMRINGEGTRNVAAVCLRIGARLIYYSTDYVFDGSKETAYLESDPTRPATVYGQSKLAGEEAVQELLDDFAILRIGWVYGSHGKNFVRTMLSLGAAQIQKKSNNEKVEKLKVVDDQYGSPTWTEDIVRQTDTILTRGLTGVYHATSEGETTWFNFAREIFRARKMEVDLIGCTTEEFPRPAHRPRRSTLENACLKKARCNSMPHYLESLKQFLRVNKEF